MYLLIEKFCDYKYVKIYIHILITILGDSCIGHFHYPQILPEPCKVDIITLSLSPDEKPKSEFSNFLHHTANQGLDGIQTCLTPKLRSSCLLKGIVFSLGNRLQWGRKI